MCAKPFRNFGRSDGMDEYLLSLGLWRKTTPKDGISFYRAVAEQVFSTQALHERVRKTCQSYIERHPTELACEWVGPLEIKAVALLFKHDVVVYKQPGKDPINITGFGFTKQIVLCWSGGDHYDSVYSRPFMEAAGFCQSILYELLYENVFGVCQAVKKGLEMIRTKPSQIPKHANNIITVVQDKLTHACSLCEPSAVVCSLSERPSYHLTPFPYKVAKSLSVEVFRNVEYDAWLESKKEEQAMAYGENLSVQTSFGRFMPGDKCQVILDGHGEHQFNAHVQEIKSESESAVVFVEELGQRKLIQWNKMTPLPKLIAMETAWKKRGKKKICECARTVLMEGDSFMGAKHPRSVAHCQHVGRRMRINSAGLPIRAPAHDVLCYTSENMHAHQIGKTSNHLKDMCSAVGPRLKNTLRQRYNSEGHYSDNLEEKRFDESVFCDQQDQKGAQPRSEDSTYELPPQQWNLTECREPAYGDTADGIATFQPQAGCDQGDVAKVPLQQHSSSPQIQLDRTLSASQPSPLHVPSATCAVVPGLPEVASSAMIQSMLRPPPGYLITVPYQNVMIPIADNFAGPINTNALPSLEANGEDLPLHDSATLRFFFNLGVQYYRSLLLVQQHIPPQSAVPYFGYPPSNGAGACLSQSSPVVTSDVYVVSDTDVFPGGAFCQASLLPSSGAIFFSSQMQCPHPSSFVQFGPASAPYQPAAI